MAKHRFSSKKKGRGHRKSAKRVAAGRKAWRTKVRRYGSKAAAVAASFGKRKARTSHRTGGRRRTTVGSRRRRLESQALKMIQERYGTTGQTPTAAEIRASQIFVTRTYGMADPRRHRAGGMSSEERIRKQAAETIARTKRAAAARLVAEKIRKRDQAEAEYKRRRAREEAEAEIAAEASRL